MRTIRSGIAGLVLTGCAVAREQTGTAAAAYIAVCSYLLK
jgi:hypothetical protein